MSSYESEYAYDPLPPGVRSYVNKYRKHVIARKHALVNYERPRAFWDYSLCEFETKYGHLCFK